MINDKMVRLLAYVTGLVNQKLLLQNEYLIAENRILRSQLPKRSQLTDAQRSTLAEIGKRLGRKALSEVTAIVQPETNPRLVPSARRPEVRRIEVSQRDRPSACFQRSSRPDRSHGKRESRRGYDRIVGALSNLGHTVCDKTVGNVLRRHGIAPAPKRRLTPTAIRFSRAIA